MSPKTSLCARSRSWWKKSIPDAFSLPTPPPGLSFLAWPQGRAGVFSSGNRIRNICHSRLEMTAPRKKSAQSRKRRTRREHGQQGKVLRTTRPREATLQWHLESQLLDIIPLTCPLRLSWLLGHLHWITPILTYLPGSSPLHSINIYILKIQMHKLFNGVWILTLDIKPITVL